MRHERAPLNMEPIAIIYNRPDRCVWLGPRLAGLTDEDSVKRFGAAAGGGGRVGRQAAVGGAGQIQRGGEGPGGEKRPQDHVNPRMEGQWGESEAISQPVDPSEVGG